VNPSEHNQLTQATDAARRTIFRAEAMQRHLERRSTTAVLRIRGAEARPAAWVQAVHRRFPRLTALMRPRARRVPALRQLTTTECGAACLAMILSYHGRATEVAECRAAMDIGRDGATALSVAQAARRYGLRVSAFSLGLDALPHLQLPAIAHWQFDHFVVLERWSSAHAEIVDPKVGRRRLTAAEFAADFTGVALTFDPGVGFERRAAAGPVWRAYLARLLRAAGVRRLLAQILGASLLLQLLALALPLATHTLVDQILPLQQSGTMATLGVGMAVVTLAQMVTGWLRATLLMTLQARLDTQMMLGFVEHILALPFRFFQQRSSGDLLMRLSSSTIIRETLTNQTVSALLDGALVLGSLVVLLVVSPLFGLLAFGLGLLQIVLLLGTARRAHDLAQRDLAAQAESQAYLVEALAGIVMVKASGAEDRAFDRWSSLFFKRLNVGIQRSRLSATVETGLTTLQLASPLLFLWLGAWQVLGGALSLGTMLALTTLATSALTPLASVVASGQELQLVGAHLERIADVVEAEPEQERLSVRPAPQLTGALELHDVSFRYDAHSPAVLRNISLTVAPGQKIALVGRSGSGKSTLAKLLLGLYVPTTGEIRYDGIPLQRLDYRTLRSQFGVAPQEVFLFSGSIRENIVFNAPDVSYAQVVAAARLAAIHDDIMRMPMGYETLVAEGGSALSGGQRQRIALARALIHQPAILVLDEATSHLDLATERIVEEHLSSLVCTRIVIAHRPSTIRNADRILVLDGGEIIASGTHEELLAQSDLYAALAQSQEPAAASDTYRAPKLVA
jgi:ABC-type bacteriocin/lantibiotic exporter with double-glycine peptidase domain